MADAREDADRPFVFEVLEGEHHWLARKKTRTAMLERSVALLGKHDPPD